MFSLKFSEYARSSLSEELAFFSVTESHALLLLVTYGSLTYLLLCLESLTKGRLT